MLSLIIIAGIIIGVSEYKQNNINTENTTQEFTTVDNNETTTREKLTTEPVDITESDSTTELTDVNQIDIDSYGIPITTFNDIFRTFQVDSLNVTFNPDGYYIIEDQESVNSLSGRYQAYNCDDAIKKEYISKKDMSSVGLKYEEIVPNNLYYIRASYETHIYSGNQEFYSFDILRPQYFEFLIYFRADESNVVYAINNIDNKLSQLDISKPIF